MRTPSAAADPRSSEAPSWRSFDRRPLVRTSSALEQQRDEPFYPEVKLDSGSKPREPLWSIANEIYTSVSETMGDDEATFNKIVRDTIVHDILSSLERAVSSTDLHVARARLWKLRVTNFRGETHEEW
jgi:hypothetical protein